MWKDISEAKKDGTVYLLQNESGRVSLGSWKEDWIMGKFLDDEEGTWVGEEGWFSEDGNDFSIGYYFTPLDPVKFLDFRGIEGYVP